MTKNEPNLKQGQLVKLDPQWPNFQYLNREFGRLFPAMIQETHGDVAVIKKTRFAHSVLTGV